MSVESGISQSTITRFVRKLGFNSFQYFKVKLAQDVLASPNNKHSSIINSNIRNNESALDSAEKLLYSNINILKIL